MAWSFMAWSLFFLPIPAQACTLSYHLPLGAFIARSCPPNILPAAKDFGASRLVAAP